jgi:hypothetical protein
MMVGCWSKRAYDGGDGDPLARERTGNIDLFPGDETCLGTSYRLF